MRLAGASQVSETIQDPLQVTAVLLPKFGTSQGTKVRSCVQVFLYFSRSAAFLEFALSRTIKVSLDRS